MIALGQSNLDFDFEAFNAAGQVWNGLAFVTYDTDDFEDYRIAATKLGNASDASVEAWHSASAPTGTYRWVMRERGATLALSYIVWTENGPREMWNSVSDTETVLVIDKE